MPQMFPMNWFILLILFSLMPMMIFSMINSNIEQKIIIKSSKKIMNNMFWTW